MASTTGSRSSGAGRAGAGRGDGRPAAARHVGAGLVEPSRFARLRLALAQLPITVAHLVRFAAVLLALVIGSEQILGSTRNVLIYGGLATYIVVTTPSRRTLLLDLTDTAAVLALVAVYGGLTNPYLPVMIAMVGVVGSSGSMLRGLLAGVTVSATVVGMTAVGGALTTARLAALSPALALLPLTGVTGALGRRVFGRRAAEGRETLELTNLLLSDLRELVDSVPGGLDVATISSAALAEIRATSEAEFGVLLINNQGLLVPVTSFGMQEVPLTPLRLEDVTGLLEPVDPRIVTADQLPAGVADLAGRTPYCGVASLREPSGDGISAVMLVGYREAEAVRSLRTRLAEVAGDTALALDNARLLADTHQESVASARRQIAHDLHDGLAQSLTHLRMELELLGMGAEDEELQRELIRLARVVERALSEVRGTIAGLRSPVTPRGLVEAVRRHVDDLDGLGGTAVRMEVHGTPRLSEDGEDQVLRVAQEAISNALRHSGGDEVVVSLRQSDDCLTLTVEDDGFGIDDLTSDSEGGGVGMSAMRDRTRRLGGTLDVRERPRGGTTVELTVPTGAHPPPRDRSAARPPTTPPRR